MGDSHLLYELCYSVWRPIANTDNKVTTLGIYSHVLHNDVVVNDRPHIRQWSHNIIILTTVLQLPTVFSKVTYCTGL